MLLRPLLLVGGWVQGVRDVCFSNDGRQFLSTGYDRNIRLWDTETGACIRTFNTNKVYYCVKFHPGDDKQNVFLAGCQDKKIYQFDTQTGGWLRTSLHKNTCSRLGCPAACPGINLLFVTRTLNTPLGLGSHHHQVLTSMWFECLHVHFLLFLPTGDTVTEYNYHLGPVNTVTFIDEGRQFVSTSDDKSIRVWELGIPVQIKYIADPSMHSIPAVTLDPTKKHLIGQSLDNQVVTYMVAKDRFKHLKNKTFKGHNTAGYACQPNFSPDARFVWCMHSGIS